MRGASNGTRRGLPGRTKSSPLFRAPTAAQLRQLRSLIEAAGSRDTFQKWSAIAECGEPLPARRGRPSGQKYLGVDWPLLVAADELYRIGRLTFEPSTAKREMRSPFAAIKLVVDRYAQVGKDGSSHAAIAKRLLARLADPATEAIFRRLELADAVRPAKRSEKFEA